jgi:hypothetical protein
MKKLDLNQMEKTQGGYECKGLARGLSGASLIFGIGTWYTGVGGGISLALGVAAYAADLAGC